ncbi:hypothetical protein I8751_26270 [Nostocaceae cyanobacterium CENA357]|uniref:Uncharacterized protein n=1 Tax=Atlanticothrix silvestris CENA357 TaxID=1725252 RepID=A0A8J7L587_9CYAN|nr:hypothetical protein [Atlanticothrix silvestris]MBH8555789.1 hypothetical protein [Atlanticothrix silvestris CENA357]
MAGEEIEIVIYPNANWIFDFYLYREKLKSTARALLNFWLLQKLEANKTKNLKLEFDSNASKRR